MTTIYHAPTTPAIERGPCGTRTGRASIIDEHFAGLGEHFARLTRPPGENLTVTSAGAPPLYAVLPFVAMLLTIAMAPLRVPHWWAKNGNKLLVALLLGAPILALYLVRHPATLL